MMKKKLFVFYGPKGSGKDTCVELLKEAGTNIGQFSFAHSLKKTVWELFKTKIKNKDRIFGAIDMKEKPIKGWTIPDNVKQMCGFTEDVWTGRRLLQWFGTDICRNIHGSIWADQLVESLYEHGHCFHYIAVSDCRFNNEYEALKKVKEFKVIFVKILRNTGDNEFSDHASEIDMKDFQEDLVIKNDGTLEELKAELLKLI